MKILAGYETTDESRDALVLAGLLADAYSADLVVGCVWASGPLLDGASVYAPIDPEWESDDERRERTERLRTAFAEASHSLGEREFTARQGIGTAAAELQRIAGEEDASMIVIGSTHRGWLGRITPGSVAGRLFNGAPCPVAIAPRDYGRSHHELGTIGVAYNGHPEAKLALAEAHRLARATGAKLRLIAAVPVEMPNLAMSMHMAMVRKRFQQGIDLAVDQIDDVAVDAVVVEADAVSALEQASKSLDLLVIGSRGYGPLRTVLLGSVSEWVVHSAICPVLVTPRGSEEHAAPRGSISNSISYVGAT